MTIAKPYARTARPNDQGQYGGAYLTDPRYAKEAAQFVHAFLLLQKDLIELFDYVEPSTGNVQCHSFRIQALLLRACVEVEANCKAILRENNYPGAERDWSMRDYRKVERSHRLSHYQVVVPNWRGEGKIRMPFAPWSAGKPLPWYEAYNRTKHDRHLHFEDASFGNLIDAVTGVFALLSAQFVSEDFSPRDPRLTAGSESLDGDEGIGEFFRVKFPEWPPEERYRFDWRTLLLTDDAIQHFRFD